MSWTTLEASVRDVKARRAHVGELALSYERASPVPQRRDDLPLREILEGLTHDGIDALFHEAFYLSRYPDARASHFTPLRHYVLVGSLEDRQAHPLFDPGFYLERFADGRLDPGGAVRHYLAVGARERRDPSAAFDASYYARMTAIAPGTEPVAHYLAAGPANPISPHPLFDAARAAVANAHSEEAPLVRYLMYGGRGDTFPHPFFDEAYYLHRYPDVSANNVHPFVHYLRYGWREGRAPNAWFSPAYYVAAYPDVAAGGCEPLRHFVEFGEAESRNPHPLFNTSYYRRTNLAADRYRSPLLDYSERLDRASIRTSPLEDLAKVEPIAPSDPTPFACDVVVTGAARSFGTRATIDSALRSGLPAGSRVLLVDRLSGDDAVAEIARSFDDRVIVTPTLGAQDLCGRDVLILWSGAIITNDLVARLRDAAHGTVPASAAIPLSNGWGAETLPRLFERVAPRPEEVAAVDHLVASSSFGLHYASSRGAAGCVYVPVAAMSPPEIVDPELLFARCSNGDMDDAGPVVLADRFTYVPAALDDDAGPDLKPYFDAEYYLRVNGPEHLDGRDPFEYYVRRGASENRRGHPLFDPVYYRYRYPECEGFPGGAIRHYVQHGAKHRFDPIAAFDAAYYARAARVSPEADALLHYLTSPASSQVAPHPLFDAEYVVGQGGGVAGRPALAAYLAQPAAARIAPHPLFDPSYYLEKNADVSASDMHPFLHFLTYGAREGRDPHAWFSTKHYIAANPDVAAAGLPALEHYVTRGFREHRSPHPLFDFDFYVDRYLGGRSDMEPLSFYVGAGVARGDLPNRFEIAPDFRAPTEAPRTGLSQRPVSVIVPVYRGLAETRGCIASLLASDLGSDVEVTIVDDASPEPDLSAYVASIADDRVSLLVNERNLGFVGSVNRAMIAAGARDVILLNSDTIVAHDWVERLRDAAYRDSRTATATPFSNNATICSFPRFCANNELDARETARIDAAAARTNAGRTFGIPTAVGFCMYVRRDALDDVGLFDEVTFGKGYGEENDFCMRASARGWRHVLAADVYVHHFGEVSFAADSAPSKQRATAVLEAMHPEYPALVARHAAHDPGLGARVALSVALTRSATTSGVLHVTHSLGGGVAQYIEAAAIATNGRHANVRLQPLGDTRVELAILNQPYEAAVLLDVERHRPLIATLLADLRVDRAIVHHILGYGFDVGALLAALELPHEFVAHDYYSICPQVTLTDAFGDYCGEPSRAGCDACITLRPPTPFVDITTWRNDRAWLVRDASAVIAPTKDVAERLKRYFPDARIRIVPHT